MSKATLQGVVPELQGAATLVQLHAKWDGIELIWTQGHRDCAYQQQLFDEGKSHAPPAKAPHCHDGALDFAILINGQPNWNDKDPAIYEKYKRVGAIAEAEGLVWGGRWPQPKTDNDHIELKNWRDLPYHG